MTTTSNFSESGNTLHLSRVFDAPRALVFSAWTTAEHLAQWFGPNGFTCHVKLDFRAGGALSIRMVGHGMDHTVFGTYSEIVAPEKIAMAIWFEDLPDHPMHQVITFAEDGGKTTLTVRHDFPPPEQLTAAQLALLAPRKGGSREGWSQTLQHLAEFVSR
jgi:uncharacterized protein YndB with AHSA1/START domain